MFWRKLYRLVKFEKKVLGDTHSRRCTVWICLSRAGFLLWCLKTRRRFKKRHASGSPPPRAGRVLTSNEMSRQSPREVIMTPQRRTVYDNVRIWGEFNATEVSGPSHRTHVDGWRQEAWTVQNLRSQDFLPVLHLGHDRWRGAENDKMVIPQLYSLPSLLPVGRSKTGQSNIVLHNPKPNLAETTRGNSHIHQIH